MLCNGNCSPIICCFTHQITKLKAVFNFYLCLHRCSLFQIFLKGVLWVVIKLRRGPLFSCFIAFLWSNFSKYFEGVHEVPPPPPPVCIYDYSPPSILWIIELMLSFCDQLNKLLCQTDIFLNILFKASLLWICKPLTPNFQI